MAQTRANRSMMVWLAVFMLLAFFVYGFQVYWTRYADDTNEQFQASRLAWLDIDADGEKAIVLSFPFTYLLSTIVSLAVFETPIATHYTWVGYTIWLGLVLVLSAIASILPARNAATMTIRKC